MSEFINELVTSEHLESLPDYHFNRDDFTKMFKKIFTTDQIEEILSKCISKEHTNYFWFLQHEDEFYILHMDSGTIINWYKHLGRTNTCNKPGFTLSDLEEFLRLVKIDIGW